MSKLSLGTAQFGLDYGINNTRGRIPSKEVFQILDAAHSGGIDTLDTASVYGDSEKVLGDYLRKSSRKFRIVSKTKEVSEKTAKISLRNSLKTLGVRSLYAYLLHDFEAFANDPSAWRTMQALKDTGVVDKVGFSLYRPRELDWILDHQVQADIIQVPVSIFDQRFLPVLEKARGRGIEIHARSVFLQGLAFKDIEGLDRRFEDMRGPLGELRSLSARTCFSLSRLCFGFVARSPFIDRVVVGVDGLAQLQELMAEDKIPDDIVAQLGRFRIDNEQILLPFLWSEKK